METHALHFERIFGETPNIFCNYGDQVKLIIVVNAALFLFSMIELSFWSMNQNVQISSVFSTVCMYVGKK